MVAEYNGVGTLPLRRYVHGAGIDEPLVWYEGAALTDRRHLHADERGSIIATSNSSAVATIYKYGPYGEPDAWTGPRFKYTGQAALPEASLYHYKARVYDPVLGRFLQTDPVGYAGGTNLYSYVTSDPLNFRDDTGPKRNGLVGESRVRATSCCKSRKLLRTKLFDFGNKARIFKVGHTRRRARSKSPHMVRKT